MHALHSVGVHHEKSQFFPNIRDCNMDYRQKMIVSTTHKYKNEDDDDEDLEALRLAALKSRRAKPTPSAKAQLPPQHNIHTGRSHCAPYNQRFGRREYYHSNRPPRQNGNVYHPSRVNQNLIEIIPVDESALSATSETKTTPDPLSATDATVSLPEPSKFHRYTDDVSGSDDEDLKEAKIPDPKSEDQKPPQDDETGTDKENQSNEGNSPRIEENDPLEDAEEDPEDDQKDPEDDDDILLMADLEEEDSLERLIDEMDREINMEKFPAEKKESSPSKTETRDSKKPRDSSKSKNRSNEKLESLGASKTDRRSVSPYSSSKPMRHRSLSPKQKPRKKSPRRSPPRQIKKSQREPLRLRSPRKSPPRYSPRPRSRSPRMSPRRSPNRSPMRRLSPRGRSPLSRSPRPRRSRSPKILSRPHSPRFINRVRSPLRMSPGRSPLPRSPKQSPHRLSPMRRASPRRSRSRSPRRSPRRSPKLSPRRLSPMRRLSPRLSPRRSPWSSPRNSPRLSPRRRRSPKERKRRSLSPEDPSLHRKENSPLRKNVQNSPEISKKVKPAKETIEVSSDPVLEARRRKFESTRPIDPITANKKIKLSKKEEIKVETAEPQVNSPKRKAREVIEEYEEVPDEELSLHEEYNFDDLEPVLSDESSGPVMCVEVAPVKVEKERVKKKKKKDKEIYQVGKMKDAMLAGRIVKEKKCKKKKELTPEVGEEEGEVVEEAVDEEADLRTELSRRRAERLNRTVPIQSARLLQSAFKGVVNEVAKAKNNAKVIQRHLGKAEEKTSQKEVRRVTVLHRTVPDLSDSEDSKMPVRFRLGTNNSLQETRESKASRKSSKRQGRKGKKLNTH